MKIIAYSNRKDFGIINLNGIYTVGKYTGRLIQPIIKFKWVDEDLTDLVNAIEINLTDNSKTCPTCRIEWKPTNESFSLFEAFKTQDPDKFWEVGIGYTNQQMFSMNFTYAGVQLTTGTKPALVSMGVSPIKGCWTDGEISYTRKEPIRLIDFPEDLKKTVGACAAHVTFSFVGGAAEKAREIDHQDNTMKMTPHKILQTVMNNYGMQVSTADTPLGGPILISYSPNLKGELAKDELTAKPGQPRLRSFHILGPTLAIQIDRNQRFNLKDNLIAGLASPKNPIVPQVLQKGLEQIKVPSDTSTVSQAVTVGTQGETNPTTGESAQTTNGSKEIDKKIALAKIIITTMNTEFPLVPRFVGIKPRDVLIIVGNNNYHEDWILTDVKYRFNSKGAVSINVSGKRPFVGEEPIYYNSPSARNQVESTIANLTTIEAWERYYWNNSSNSSFPELLSPPPILSQS